MNPLFHVLFQTSRNLAKEINDTLEPFGLYNAQWTILYCLRKNGPMSLTEIWKYLNVEAPTITRTVNRLEELGWIEKRAGEDKREKIVYLSEDALAKFDDIKASILQFENRISERLTVEEQNNLVEILLKLRMER